MNDLIIVLNDKYLPVVSSVHRSHVFDCVRIVVFVASFRFVRFLYNYFIRVYFA